MWHFRKSRCSAVHGYVSLATRAFLCFPSHSLSCLRLFKILQKKVKPMYNSFMMKCLIPAPSEGLFNFQRLKYNYVYFSMTNLAHCPCPIMVAICFERNSHAFLFLRFAYSYQNIGFHETMSGIKGKKNTKKKRQSLHSLAQCLWKYPLACFSSRVCFSPLSPLLAAI